MSEPTTSQDPSQDLELFLPRAFGSIVTSGTSAAVAVAKRATAIAARIRDEGLVTEHKTPVSDVVIAADRAVEKLAVEALVALRPEDGTPGEEGSAKESQTGRTWVINPVDGTYNSITGSDYWRSALTLVMGDANNLNEVILGAVHRPAMSENWAGSPDLPTTRINIGGTVDDLRVTDHPLSEACVATYLHITVVNPSEESEVTAIKPWLDAVSHSATWRMLGSTSVGMTGVADGRVGAWFQHDVAAWDWLLGYALITGAGGEYTSVGRWKLAGSSGQAAELSEVLC